MLNLVSLKLKTIKYKGDSIGRDIRVDIRAFNKPFEIEKRIKVGEIKKVNQEIARIETDKELLETDIFVTVTEKDLLFNDTGSIQSDIKIDTTSKKLHSFSFEVEVRENRSLFNILFWGNKKAIFEIELEAAVNAMADAGSQGTIGKIALYSDVVSNLEAVNLRQEADEKSETLKEIPNQAEILIVNKAVGGSRPPGFMSDLWHEVSYQSTQGFVHSDFVEINGQEREKIIEAIKTKAKELGVDEDLALNLTHCESKWLPFARSETDNRGICQLGARTVKDINEKHSGNILNVYDPYQNIDGGMKYLRFLLKRYANSSDYLTRVIVAWNVGYNKVPIKKGFSIENYRDRETHRLVGCTLQEKRGGDTLKYLKLSILPLIVSIGLLGLINFNINKDNANKETGEQIFEQKEIAYLKEGDNIADISPSDFREKEAELGYLRTDMNADKILEKITFTFSSPEDFSYYTNIYAPNREKTVIDGSLWEAFVDDLTGDGVKELIVQTIPAHLSFTNIFQYQNGALRRIPIYNKEGKKLFPTELGTSDKVKFEDLDGDKVKEIILVIKNYSREFIEPTYYYRWNGDSFVLYDQKDIPYIPGTG